MSANYPRIASVYDGEAVSPELPSLMAELRGAVVRPAVDREVVAGALRRLLEFLASPQGRTNANCGAVDSFCMDPANWNDRGFEQLPLGLAEILGDMGSALHDTVQAPEIAANFASTPEQLLARLTEFELNAPPA